MILKKQTGFTLVEIAIVLVIVGLLLGGVLKGQELINSARVKNLADQNTGVQVAYYAFIDRYRRVPGDWDEGDAKKSIGVDIFNGGNNNGKIDDTDVAELAGVWEQLAKAGFLQGAVGSYTATAENATYTDHALSNPFQGKALLARTLAYQDNQNNAKLGYMFGNNIPAAIMRELDVKLDDGSAETGALRSVTDDGSGIVDSITGDPCANNGTDTGWEGDWAIEAGADNCNGMFLY